MKAIEGLEIDGEAATPACADRTRDRWRWRRKFWRAFNGECGLSERRKKKLIVAFHFLRSDRPGGNATQCRRQGLEARRRCGFLPEEQRGAPRVVWARGRGGVGGVSDVAGDSGRVWSWLRSSSLESSRRSAGEPTAREADAFLILEREWRAEQANGQQ